MGYFTCQNIPIDNYVRNLTLSYAGRSNETLVVASSVFMCILATGFLALSIFSRVANLSSVHHPHGSLLLNIAISFFLAVMSYLFSQAKKETECMAEPDGLQLGLGLEPELAPRALEILTWMLLVQLLRKKVEPVNIVGEGRERYIGVFTDAGTVIWLGYLVFTNVKEPGRVAVFGFLWIICATKWVNRLVLAELKRRSLAYDKNPRLVSSYMDQMMLQLPTQDVPGPDHKLKTCEYVVMGEEKLVVEAGGPWGYRLRGLDKATNVVTVGKVWRLADAQVQEEGHRPLLRSNSTFKRLCLSMALFKLLRPRIERLSSAMSSQATDHCRDLILQGLLQEDQDGGSEVFEVLIDEVDLLSEYYHSVHPVVLASPYFFAVNYLVLPAVVCFLGFTTVVLSGNGHVLSTFRSIKHNNNHAVFTLLRCLLQKAVSTPLAFFPAIDVLISYFLLIAFAWDILIELVVFLLSKWFMVSLLCSYVAKSRWRHRSVFPWAIRFISWARRTLRHPSLITFNFKQFSVLRRCWLSVTLPGARLPTEAKRSIVKRFRLAAYGGLATAPLTLSKGIRPLEMPGRHQYMHLSWFCNFYCVGEVILTWHIATSLLEMEHPYRKPKGRPDIVATRLSNYLAYLVGSWPQLLPGYPEGTKRAFINMKKDLRKELGLWVYYFSSKRARYNKMMMMVTSGNKLRPDNHDESMTVVQRGIVLGQALIDASKGNDQPVWELLADVWVELIVYVSPSSSDEQVKGHKEALMRGGELVTLLWALAMHTGITRPPPTAVPVELVEDGICSA